MRLKKLKVSPNPLNKSAGFFILKQSQIKKLFTKLVASSLVLSFSFSQLVWAADVRQMLLDAKSSFDLESQGRGDTMSGEELASSHAAQQAMIEQQSALQDLQSMNFSLTTANGDILKYVGDKLDSVTRPDGAELQNITVDASGNIVNADLRLSDGSVQIYQNGQVIGYETPDGSQVFYENGQIIKTLSKDGVETLYSYVKNESGVITETVLESSTHRTIYDANGKLKEVLSKGDGQKTFYSSGMIQKIVKEDGSEITFTSQTDTEGNITLTSQATITSYTDPQGNKFIFDNGNITKIKLADDSYFDGIAWGTDSKIKNVTYHALDGSRYIYTDKKLTQSYTAQDVLTSYTYNVVNILAVSQGTTWQYLLDKTPVSVTYADGSATGFYTQGAFKGLKQKDISVSGVVTVYEYVMNGSTPSQVLKKDIVGNVINEYLYVSTSYLAYSSNPKIKFSAAFPASGDTTNSSVRAMATDLNSTKILYADLVVGTGSSWTFNGVKKPLGITIQKGLTYNIEMVWQSSGVAIYVYESTKTRPSTPTALVADKSWNPKLVADGKNVVLKLDTTSSGTYGKVQSFYEAAQSYLPAKPSQVLNFKFDSVSSANNKITLSAAQQKTASTTRTYMFAYVSGKWNVVYTEVDSITKKATSGNLFSVSQSLKSDTSYISELLFEGNKLNLYVYAVGSARPVKPTASVDALSTAARFSATFGNATYSGEMYKNSSTASYTSAYAAKALTPFSQILFQDTKPSASLASSSFEYKSIVYDSEFRLKSVETQSGKKYLFSQGVLNKVLDTDGSEISISFEESALSNLLGSSIIQNGVESSYDASGSLSSVKLGDLTVHYKEGAIDFVEQADGSELYDLVFDENGVITSASIYTPDGELRTYVDGKLTSLTKPDLTKLFYLDDKLFKLVTPEDLTYNFTYTPEAIEARLEGAIEVPDALTPVTMQYDANFNLKKVVRQNQEIINYLGNDILKIEAPSEAPKVFAYNRDAEGKVLSYTITQDNMVTTYDANHQPLTAVIGATSDNPHTLEVLYQYGKIRHINKDGVLTFKYTYTFDVDNHELTTIEDLEEKTRKVYRDSKLLTDFDEDNSVLSTYEYQNAENVSRVVVTRLGRTLHTYDYSYSGDHTVVLDEEGVKRTYSVDKKLLFLEKNGEKFSYSYSMENGSEILSYNETDLPVSTYDTLDRSLNEDGQSLGWFEKHWEGYALSTPWDDQWVTYSVTTDESGFLAISLEAINDGEYELVPDYEAFIVEISVDGVVRGQMEVPASGSEWKNAEILLQNIQPGEHVVKLEWLNDIWDESGPYDTNFKFRNLQMTLKEPVYKQVEIAQETLIEKTLSSGAVAHYENGQVQRIDLADGSYLTDIGLNENRTLNHATAHTLSGEQWVVTPDGVSEKILPDGHHFYFSGGKLAKVTSVDGSDLFYSYETGSGGAIQNILVREGDASFKYDATGTLLGMNVDSILSAEEARDLSVHATQGGSDGVYSYDGNWNSAQTGGRSQNLYSEINFTEPQTINSVTYRMVAAADSNGPTDNGSTAQSEIQVKDASTGQWTTVPGTSIYQSHNNGGGGGSTAFATTANPATVSVGLSNVIAIRAHAVAHAFANEGGGSSAYSAIYELQYSLADQSYMSFSKTYAQSGGALDGYRLDNPIGFVKFGLDGNITTSSSVAFMTQVRDAVDKIGDYLNTPNLDLISIENPEDFASWLSSAQDLVLDSQVVVSQEYANDGTLEVQVKADKSVTIFEANKPSFVMDENGSTIMEYSYDAQGNLTGVYLKKARDTLPGEILRAKQQIEASRASSLEALAQQKNLAYQSIKSTADTQKNILQIQLSDYENWYDSVKSNGVKGKAARAQKALSLESLDGAINQILGGITQVSQSEADAYARLDAQVQMVSDGIELDARAAFTELAVQEQNLKKEIIRQEISPVVYDHYRRILGRDPSSDEYDYWVSQVDYDAAGDLSGELTDYLNELPELSQRQGYVEDIKNAVSDSINEYLSFSQAEKENFAASLGLQASDLISLSTSDAQKILSWLSTRSLHFGQSAFLSLESLLDQKGISYIREDLAKKCILVDILTGVISPLDDGDLVLSLFSLNKVAGLYGLSLVGADLSWDDLLAIVPAQAGSDTARVIAHINGNHFVIVTAITEDSITYIDPGRGKDKQNEVMTLSKKDFLRGWEGKVTLEGNKLQSISGGQNKILSSEETQKIRGAFFFFFIPAIIGALTQIGAAVWAVLNAVGTILAAIGSLVADIVVGIGQALGQMMAGVGQIANNIFQGIKFAASSLFKALGNPGSLLSQGSFGSAAKAGFGNTIFQNIVKTGINFAINKGLDALGVDPMVTRFVGAFVTGGYGGFTSPISAAQTLAGVTRASVIASSIFQSVALEGIGQAGLRLGLDSGFANIISLSVAAIGGQIIQNPSTTLGMAFSNIKAELFSSLAQYGIEKLGTSLGLDPRIASLIGTPINGAIGAVIIGGANVGQNIIASIQDGLFQKIISIGIETGMQALNIPVYAKDFIKGLFENIKINGVEFGSKMMGVLKEGLKFLLNVPLELLRNIVGAAQEIGEAVAGGLDMFTHGLGSFRSLFSSKTQEAIYKYETELSSGEITRDGDVYKFNTEDTSIEYDVVKDVLIERNGDRYLWAQGLSHGEDGSIYYEKLSYQRLLEDSVILEENFEKGRLMSWSYLYGDSPILSVDLGGKEYSVLTEELFYDANDIKFDAPIEFIDPSTANDPTPKSYYVPLKFNFSVVNGEIIQSSADIIQSHSEDPRLDKELYILTNGILNDNIKLEGAPEYLRNFKSDIVSHSVDPKVVDNDVILAPTFFSSAILRLWGTLESAAVIAATNLSSFSAVVATIFDYVSDQVTDTLISASKDIVSWLVEASNPTIQSALASEIQNAVEAYFSGYNRQIQRQRSTVAIGYSGGFVPMVEAIAKEVYDPDLHTGYNVKTLMAIGAALIKPSQVLNDILIKILEAEDYLERPAEVAQNLIRTTLENLDALLSGNIGNVVIENIMRFIAQATPELARQEYEKAVVKIKDYMPDLFSGFVLDDLTHTNAEMIVNIYGTEDILTKLAVNGNSIGGFRDEMGGFSASGVTKALVNIEIVGASHYDYMRRSDTTSNFLSILSPEQKAWNERVADFVTALTINSADFESVDRFLKNPPADLQADIVREGDQWIVKLLGWNSRVTA